MGGVSSVIDAVQQVATFGYGFFAAERFDFEMVDDNESGYERQRESFCYCFQLDLLTRPETGNGRDSGTILLSTENILGIICKNLEVNDLLRVRGINKLWNVSACKHLRQSRAYETLLTTDDDICRFLAMLKNVVEPHPFTDVVVDLWDISLENALDLTRELGWIQGLTLLGVSPCNSTIQEFILKEISTKIAVILHGVPSLESLSVKTEFEIYLSGILDLILPEQFPQLRSFLLHVLQWDSNHRGYFLEDVIARSPGLTSIGVILPDDEDTTFLERLTQENPKVNFSLATPLSVTNIQTLRDKRIEFTSLRIHIRNFENDDLREELYSWLSSQSESLVTLGLTFEFTTGPAEGSWALPTFDQLEVLSILIIGSSQSKILHPFRSGQLPKLTSFAFVQASAPMTFFGEDVFPNLTAVGFSGKNGVLDENLSLYLPNLKHVTLCGVSQQHLSVILTKFPSLVEFVLIFEGNEGDLWAELTGGAAKSWEDFYDELFGNFEISDSLEEDWASLTLTEEEIGDTNVESTLFQESLEGLDQTKRQFTGKNGTLLPSLANMKCLEYLKYLGWNAGAFSGLVHMTSTQTIPPLSHLQLQIPPESIVPSDSLDILRAYHKEVTIDT